jgi:hypothetical protein
MKKKWAKDSGQTSSGRKSVKRASSEFTCATATVCLQLRVLEVLMHLVYDTETNSLLSVHHTAQAVRLC